MLIVCDANATVQIMYNGNFPLCRFSLKDLLPHTDEQSTVRIAKAHLSKDWTELGLLTSIKGEDTFVSIDTEALKELVLDNTLVHDFFSKLPELELYLDYMDKRVTKCKDAWLKFYRTYNGCFGRIAGKIKERDARMGSMNPDDY